MCAIYCEFTELDAHRLQRAFVNEMMLDDLGCIEDLFGKYLELGMTHHQAVDILNKLKTSYPEDTFDRDWKIAREAIDHLYGQLHLGWDE